VKENEENRERVKAPVKTYTELKVWEQSYKVCLEVYRITMGFPKEETYGLMSQMRRAAVSIPSNIAEGFGRRTTPDFLRSLYIAYGSVCELETQILLSKDLGYVGRGSTEKIQSQVREVERMLKALIKALQKKHLST
jgi:four helix bundle protein